MNGMHSTTMWLSIVAVFSLPAVGATQDAAVVPSSARLAPSVGKALPTSGYLPVIVSLDEQAIGALRARDDDSRFAARSAAVDSVLRRLPSSSYKNAWHDPHISGFFLDINKDALQALGSAPEVRRVEYYPSMSVALQESVRLVDASAARVHCGLRGNQQNIAILDTGVDFTHPMLSGKAVRTACFSRSQSGVGYCPNGTDEQFDGDSAKPCDYASSCYHGTHVAGIAAGRAGTGTCAALQGVAPDAGLVAVQVYRDAVKWLTGLGVAVVVAAGNDAWDNNLSHPASLTETISVGSVSKEDTLSTFSNTATCLDLLAPGGSVLSGIKSTIPGGTCASTHGGNPTAGTSQAAPHVAGAFALLRQISPAASVQDLLDKLRRSGEWLPTSATAGYVPRIDVYRAARTLNRCPDRELLTGDGQLVYWLQNGRRYHVASSSILDQMQAGALPGWSWSAIRQVNNLELFNNRGDLLTSSTTSDGLLLKHPGNETALDQKVFWTHDGRRHHIANPECFDSLHLMWSDVIEVVPDVLAISPAASERDSCSGMFRVVHQESGGTRVRGSTRRVAFRSVVKVDRFVRYIENIVDHALIALGSTVPIGSQYEGEFEWTVPSVPEGSYRLIVVGYDSAGNTGIAESAVPFQIVNACTAPAVTSLSSSTGTAGSFGLSWTGLGNVTQYILQESSDGSFGAACTGDFGPSCQQSLAGTSRFVSGRANGIYWYRVAGVNACGQGPWSNVVSISVNQNYGPGVSNFSPADGAVDQPLATTLSWTGSHLGGEGNGVFKVLNKGTVAVPGGKFNVGFYLSKNTTLDGTDALFLTIRPTGSIPAGGGARIVVKKTLSRGTTASGSYVLGVVDVNGEVAETNEANNTVPSAKVP